MIVCRENHYYIDRNYILIPPNMGVSKNNGKTPQIIHLFIGVSIIFTIHWGVKSPYFWFNIHMKTTNPESLNFSHESGRSSVGGYPGYPKSSNYITTSSQGSWFSNDFWSNSCPFNLACFIGWLDGGPPYHGQKVKVRWCFGRFAWSSWGTSEFGCRGAHINWARCFHLDVVDTVDGWNPAPVEVGSLSHYIPGGAEFLPSTVFSACFEFTKSLPSSLVKRRHFWSWFDYTPEK